MAALIQSVLASVSKVTDITKEYVVKGLNFSAI